MAIIFAKTTIDKALILGQRQALIYPFTAPGWLALKLGLWLSLTGPEGDDDSLSSLAETVTSAAADKWWIGLKDNTNGLPEQAGVDFAGFYPSNFAATGNSDLSETSPDAQYRYAHALANPVQGGLFNGTTSHEAGGHSPQFRIAFPNVSSVINGYSAFFSVNVFRTIATSTLTQCALSYPTNSGVGDDPTVVGGSNIFTSNPTITSLRYQMRTVQYGTPNSLDLSSTSALGAVYIYWPFYNSRLRIHALCLEKFL